MKYVIISLIVCITIVAIAAINRYYEKKIVGIIDSKNRQSAACFLVLN